MANYPLSPLTPGILKAASPGDPFLAFYREMNRLFDDLGRGSLWPAPAHDAQGGMLLAPHMDVSETDTELRLQAELPGVAEQDIEVSLDDDVLTLRAVKRQEQQEQRQGMHVSERSFGTFQRSLRLPFPADPDQVKATFESGVLTVAIPRSPQHERRRRIEVQALGQQSGAGQPKLPSKAGQAPPGP